MKLHILNKKSLSKLKEWLDKEDLTKYTRKNTQICKRKIGIL